MEYERYLKEVVSVLENDPDFRKKMEEAKPEEFKEKTNAKNGVGWTNRKTVGFSGR